IMKMKPDIKNMTLDEYLEYEVDVDLEKEEVEVEDDDDGDTYDIWDITVEDVELIRLVRLRHYALWKVIENGNSYATTTVTTNEDGSSTSTTITVPVTTEEKLKKKNDVKARTIKARFGGNEATKKTQKTLLKQMYENFNAPSTESLDLIFNRLQKIVSQLAILGENISQKDLNLKFLRSLPIEWNTHVVVWRNKPDLDMMSFDDLYNNFKIVEQEVKRSVSSSSDSNSQNVAFVSTLSSTNDVNTASAHISTGSTPICTVSTNSTSLSDATVYAFLANQPNGSQLIHEDLEQLHGDDLEEMDLKWNLALLRHFARECRGPTNQDYRSRNQDNKNKSQDNSKKTVNMEVNSPTVMIAIDGTGFDWSFMVEEEIPTYMALMAFSYSKVLNNKACSNSCLKNYETLKKQYDSLRTEFNKSEFDLANYKRGLASVEEQLVFYKKNEVAFCDQIAVLKRDASFKDSEINALKIQVEKLKKEKESIKIKVDGFENAAKSLDTLMGSQVTFINKRGIRFKSYNAVAPSPTGLFAPPSIDLSNSGLKEFQQPEFPSYGVNVNENVFDYDEEEFEVRENEHVPTKPKQADEPRKTSEIPKNNSTSWNIPMSKKLGVGFQFKPKACFVCGSFSHLIKDCNFQDKRMAQKPVLSNVNKRTNKGTDQREVRPVWNINTARTNPVNYGNAKSVSNAVRKAGDNAVKPSACWTWRPNGRIVDHTIKIMMVDLLLLLKVQREFCGIKRIKRELNNARTPLQNGVAERKNMTLIEATRTMLAGAAQDQGEGSAIPAGSQTPLIMSVKDNMKLQELTVLVPKLESKIDSLEKELKDTKQTFGNAILTLVKKVKSLEVALKRKSKKVIVSESEDEEPEDQGRKI
ncbi:hypothetical protein Tco_0827606, partial [Tanacetum coccineum]